MTINWNVSSNWHQRVLVEFRTTLNIYLSLLRLEMRAMILPEKRCCLPDSAELNAEGLHFDEELLNVDDLVTDQRLKKNAKESYQTVLKEK